MGTRPSSSRATLGGGGLYGAVDAAPPSPLPLPFFFLSGTPSLMPCMYCTCERVARPTLGVACLDTHARGGPARHRRVPRKRPAPVLPTGQSPGRDPIALRCPGRTSALPVLSPRWGRVLHRAGMDNPTDAAAAQTRATVGPSPPPPRARPPPSRRPHVTDLVLAAVVRAAATVGRMDVDVAPRTAPAEPVPRRAVAAGTPPPPPLHHVAANGGATTNAPPPPLPLSSFLSPPLVRRWTSPLPVLGVTVTTVDQPGRWMGDADLAALAATLRTVAVASMGTVPSHRLFARGDAAREVLANRVVAVAVDTASGAPVGFVAMVYLSLSGGAVGVGGHHTANVAAAPVLHLGLTMIAAAARGRRLQSPLFLRALTFALVNLGSPRCVVTNIGASPAGVGAVADYFVGVYPHYATAVAGDDGGSGDGGGGSSSSGGSSGGGGGGAGGGGARPEAWHLAVARGVLDAHRHEFGCSAAATFDETTFVVARSNADATDGGCVELLKADGGFVSAYKVEACNRWCAATLNTAAGDEVFQVGRVDVVGTWLKYQSSGWGREPARRGQASGGDTEGVVGGGGGGWGRQASLVVLGGWAELGAAVAAVVAVVGLWLWLGGGGGRGWCTARAH